jgi:cobalt-zinc-cadmium efflux system membrane fusion protein
MKFKRRLHFYGGLTACLLLAGCGKKFDPSAGAPPSGQQVVETGDASLITVGRPDQFPLVAAGQIEAPAELKVTGSVNPDISREVPAISLASGRIVSIKARLDDKVKKGQLLLQVQSTDVTNAFDYYLKAVNDEQVTSRAFIRAKDLYAHGAAPLSQLEQADGAEKDAKADLVAAEEQLKTLGVDKDHPSSIVNVYAPITGVIVAQNVTDDAAAGMTYSGTSTLFTIADLSTIWVICDVYENDIPKIHLGQKARIRIDAYPGKVLIGRISDIGPVLDPTIRTAKVRVEVPNPGILRLGMFVTATFESRRSQVFAVVPSSAILHLHDRDWVFVPAGGKQFRRVEVSGGNMLPGSKQQILSGLAPGQQIVANALDLEAKLEAQ